MLYGILFVLGVCALTLIIYPFYWLYEVINGLVRIGWLAVLIEILVVPGAIYGLVWLVRGLRAYVKNLPDLAKHSERLQEKRKRNAGEDV
ncbi:hypothetical protein [Brevibacterium epidermidis]|uniref:hypothetical protein n=1 Tax=Brevibacterium epidermidis TaxID=1698 RepID=UPI000BF24D5B|nr:hypothetical protein [Brevibacterium epidermidis]